MQGPQQAVWKKGKKKLKGSTFKEDMLRALVVELIREFVLPTNPTRAGELIKRVEETDRQKGGPEDDLDIDGDDDGNYVAGHASRRSSPSGSILRPWPKSTAPTRSSTNIWRGFVLTLRQLFYKFVSRAVIANTLNEYKRLGVIVRDGRRAGLIDWAAIEDRTRNLDNWRTYRSPEDAVRKIAADYAEDPWRGQRRRPEVWIEKDALVGVIEPVCRRWMLPSFAARGNGSNKRTLSGWQRFADILGDGQTPIVLHLGDHDPTGLDATATCASGWRPRGHRRPPHRAQLRPSPALCAAAPKPGQRDGFPRRRLRA